MEKPKNSLSRKIFLFFPLVFCAFIILIFSLPAKAQENPEWVVFNTGNSGLPSNAITSIAIDTSSVIWIGTYDKGLASYANPHWKVYNISNSNIPSNYITSIVIDQKNNKWIGTLCYPNPNGPYFPWVGGGLAKFDNKNWTIWDEKNSGIPIDYIYSLAIDSSKYIWVGVYYTGLFVFNGTNWTNYNTTSGLISNWIQTISIDCNDNKWIGTYKSGISEYDGKSWTSFTIKNSELKDSIIKSIAFDDSCYKWIATMSSGLFKFDGSNWTVYNADNSDLPSDSVNFILIDSADNKWIGTQKGLAKLNGNSWTAFNTSNSGLPDNCVTFIMLDSAGNKLIGTNKGGLAIYREGGVILDVNNKEKPQIQSQPNHLSTQPNPFNNITTIRFSMPSPSAVTLKIFDVLGNEVATLIKNEMRTEGEYSVPFDGSNMQTGVYFCQLRTANNVETRQMAVIK